MPSSTSSSSAAVGSPAERCPADGRLRHVAYAALAALVVAGGMEVGWRSWGLRPGIVDGERSWVAARERVRPGSAVFLGTSRAQAALDPAAWEEETGTHAVQLALPGAPPIPMLRELAADDSFHGSVILDFKSSLFFQMDYPEYDSIGDGALAALDDARRFWRHPAESIEATLDAALSGRLAIRTPGISPRETLVRSGSGAGLREVKYAVVRRDRFAPRDFDVLNPEQHGLRQVDALRGRGRAATENERDALIAELDDVVRELARKGVLVVLIRLPVCGPMAEMEAEEYPNEIYWDVVRDRVSAPSVDFAEHPTLDPDGCFDGSHIDGRTASEFTRELARIVSEVAASAVVAHRARP